MNEKEFRKILYKGFNKGEYIIYKDHMDSLTEMAKEYTAVPQSYMGVDSWNDECELSDAQLKFINILLKTIDFSLNDDEVELLSDIKYTNKYSEYESEKLNKIRTRYIEWLQKNK